MAERLSRLPDARVVIVDNGSTYGPLVEWLAACPYPVFRCYENLGQNAAWKSGVVWDERGTDWYVVSDPDLDVSALPDDAIEHLKKAFDRYPTVQKAGLSLQIDDLPDHFPQKAEVVEWESQFWRQKLDPDFYHAPVGHTFALYNRKRPCVSWLQPMCSVRSAPPYAARHLPWYMDSAAIDDEYLQYMKKADARYTHWTHQLYERAVYDM